jgi:hypothetical protein
MAPKIGPVTDIYELGPFCLDKLNSTPRCEQARPARPGAVRANSFKQNQRPERPKRWCKLKILRVLNGRDSSWDRPVLLRHHFQSRERE